MPTNTVNEEKFRRCEKVIKECIDFASRFLEIIPPLQVMLEDCPSQRFPTKYNAAESDNHNIWINLPWMLERIDDHTDDVEFFIFHELRHIHQLNCIGLKNSGQVFPEEKSRVEKWEYGFNHYVRNVDAASQSQNVTQEVEIDANAYGIVLVNLYHLDDDMEIHLSLPREADALAEPRSRKYYQTEKKVFDYLLERGYTLRSSQTEQPKQSGTYIREHKKISPNAPCPCGSGKKFKKCCRGNGKYD